MFERDWQLFLKDIHESAARIVAYVGTMSSEEFFQDPKSVDAVMRNLAIIGEAAKKIPADARRRYPSVEWKKMAGLRDIVVHDYFGIDEDIIWDVVTRSIPDLKRHINIMISEVFKN